MVLIVADLVAVGGDRGRTEWIEAGLEGGEFGIDVERVGPTIVRWDHHPFGQPSSRAGNSSTASAMGTTLSMPSWRSR